YRPHYAARRPPSGSAVSHSYQTAPPRASRRFFQIQPVRQTIFSAARGSTRAKYSSRRRSPLPVKRGGAGGGVTSPSPPQSKPSRKRHNSNSYRSAAAAAPYRRSLPAAG